MPPEHFDVLIVGAGLSGIGAACHLKQHCPDRSFAIIEARERSGGTWDLFRYPGVRSDSDMYTLGYAFRPWGGEKSIADGASILRYLRDTAREHGIDERILYRHRAIAASWSSEQSSWTVDLAREGQSPSRIVCNFLFMCSGYFRYSSGYAPEFPGMQRFGGRIVHPQQWSDGVEWAGKRVVVIGSGATAMTLVPALAETAAHVTLLQRSPTYVVARPAIDPLMQRLQRVLPRRWAHGITRWKQVLLGQHFFSLCRRNPALAKKMLLDGVRHALGAQFDIERHFTPRYNPWEQRLCLLPDGDLFRTIREQRASIVTDRIETFTETGLALRSGEHLDADLIVTATGLELQALGGVRLVVDGAAVDPARTLSYKGLMLSGVPNLASIFGYTNASWTLKSDLAAAYLCRLLGFMRRRGFVQCTPRVPDEGIAAEPWVDFSSGYLQRSLAKFPRQGSKAPWKLYQNYLRDIALLRFGRIDDGALQFGASTLTPTLSRVRERE